MKKQILQWTFGVTLTLLTGCTSAPKHLVIAPQLFHAPSNIYQQKQAKLTVTDLRSSPHIVQILRSDEAAQLLSPQQSLALIVEQALTPALTGQGLALGDIATQNIEVIIDSALVSVQQQLVKYQANNAIRIRVVIDNGSQTLTKGFNITGNSNGPLTADIAVLERDFNQHLSKLLTQIIQNQEIQHFIR